MKKFLLFAAATLVAGMAFAQDSAPAADGGWVKFDPNKYPTKGMLDKNYIVNGGFDDPNFSTAGNPYGSWYSVPIEEAKEIPNWYLSTGGCWNGVVQVLEQTPDDYMITPDNKYYVDLHNCMVNGWTNVKLTNIVTGLTPGKTYTLDMYVCHQFNNPRDGANPDHGFNIYGKDPSGATTHEVAIKESHVVLDDEGNPVLDENGKEVKEEVIVGYRTEPMVGALLFANNELSEEAEWEYQVYTFVPTEDTVFFEIWTHNYTGEGNNSGNCWADFDEIRIYDADAIHEDGVDAVAIDLNDASLEYYTLQGVRMPAGAALHGTFIAKSGKRAHKVYIR